MAQKKILIFVDYDNLNQIQKDNGLRVLIQKIFDLSCFEFGFSGSCDLRVYGGWYEGEELSQQGQSLAVRLNDDFPCLINSAAKNLEICKIRTSAELAFSMLEDPSHHLLDTYRKKNKPKNIKILSACDVDCNSSNCLLPALKKIIGTGKCPQQNCTSKSNDLLYRAEQKIVDTMLSCDLIYSLQYLPDYIYLISADDDFLPSLRVSLLRGANIIRVNPQRNTLRPRVIVRDRILKELEL